VTPEAFREQARRYGDRAEAFLKLYPAETADQAGAAQAASSRDQALVSMYLWAREREKTSKTRTYLYLWHHALPGPDAARFGAFHTSEVPYVMNTLSMSDRPFVDADHEIADMLSSYWANFAANGDPNGKGLPSWPAVGEEPEVMELGDKTTPIRPQAAPRSTRSSRRTSRSRSPTGRRAPPETAVRLAFALPVRRRHHRRAGANIHCLTRRRTVLHGGKCRFAGRPGEPDDA